MSKNLRQLPGPKKTLLLGNTVDFGRDPLGFLTRCAQEYGEIVPLRFVLTPAFVLTQPEHIEQVLKEREVFIKNTPAWRAVRSLVGEGLLTSEGEFWARQRRLAQPIFHQQRIAAYGETMVAYAQRMLDTWQEGEIRDVHQDMMHLTLNIVTKTLFNSDMAGVEAQTVAHTLDMAMQWFAESRKHGFLPLNWLPTASNRHYKNALQAMDKTIYDLIQQRRSGGEDPGDLLSMLIQVRDEADGSQMTARQLRDELATLMLAGHETTANTLSWTWMLLSQYPDVQTKLVDELRSVLGDRPPTVADLPHLRYANQVIKESLRLYPPVFSIARSPIQDYQFGGYQLPAGCIVIISPWVMQRSDRYFPHAAVFQPERWDNALEKQLPKGVYFPFGEGPRTCIGKGFALMEAVLLLSTIAQKFQLTLVPDHPIVPLASMTLRPQYGIKVMLAKR